MVFKHSCRVAFIRGISYFKLVQNGKMNTCSYLPFFGITLFRPISVGSDHSLWLLSATCNPSVDEKRYHSSTTCAHVKTSLTTVPEDRPIPRSIHLLLTSIQISTHLTPSFFTAYRFFLRDLIAAAVCTCFFAPR